MSPTPTQKPPETKKSLCNHVSDAESEKVELVEADLLLVDSTSRSTGGAGETPVKKPLKKSTKVEDDKTGKKIHSAIIDKVPKKNAQRAKGSISLNKTLEKTGAELTEKKRLAFDSSDSISTTKEEDNVENIKSGLDGRRTPVSVRSKGSKTKTATKKPAKKDSKDSKSKIQKPWMDAVEKLSSNTLEKKITAETITKEDFVEVQSAEIHPLNPPFATCSFFEKLQQGVKSYFGSKNSFTPCDKNKKEGGNQNSASIANGVKEDDKKRDPGLILKSDIYISESDLFHDELRSNSNLGGQSNDFSNDKPKIFRKLKRKKLYHPKKYYVNIQIPRKGYFYRSTIQFKTPGSPASGQFERLESHDVSKSKSKIQIPRLASTSSKVSNLPNKKRLKAKKENFEEVSNLGSVLSDDCFSFKYLDRLSSVLDDEKFGCSFEQKFNDYLTLHWPIGNLHPWEKKKLRLNNDKILNPELVEENQIDAISEGLFRSDSQKTMNRVKKKFLNERGKFSEILDMTSERVLPTIKMQKRASESTFETLINCINSTLGNDKHFSELEITSINPVKGGMNETHTGPSNRQGFTEIPLQFTEIINSSNNLNNSTVVENSSKPETLYFPPPIFPTTFYQPDIKPIASLMEEVDLHLELENYLKGYDKFTKNKAKSTQENSFSNSVDCLNEKNRISEVKESKSSSSFASATSYGSLEDESRNQLRVFLDCKRDMMSLSEECMSARPPRTFNLQTKLTDESSEIRKIRSENNPRILPQDSKLNSSIKRTFGKTSFHLFLLDDKESMILRHLSSVSKDLSTEDSVDSYEKNTPFNISSNKSCNDTRTRNKGHVLFENRVYSLSAESVAQRVWKVASDMNHSDTKSSDDFKIVEPIRSTLHKKLSTSEIMLPSNPHPVSNTPKWSPTLQDLIDIYNSVLKQNRKIRRNSKNSVKNCFSSHLFNFLNEKLQEKQFKANLIKLSKDFNNYKPQKPWKLPTKKEDSVSLKEYVAMFQEILQSSLSISQITRLNNIISGLQDYSERNYSFFKDIKKTVDADAGTKKNVPVIENMETALKINAIPQSKLLSQTKFKAYFPKKSPNETMKASNLSKELSEIRSGQTKKPMSEKMKAKSKEEVYEIELSSPSNLENLLRTCFDSVDVFRNDPGKMNVKNKMLVTVKVSGNRIFVSSLSYFNNEDELSSQRIKPGETSELIIESVTRDQVPDVSYKCMKINKLKHLKPSYAKETSNKSEIKFKKGKASKARKSQKQTKEQAKEITSDSNSKIDELLQEPSEPVFPFEYDQMQLRVQHPIEAIIESSESKISQIFEDSNKDNSEMSSTNKILLKDIHNNSMVVKEAVKEALAENVFTKDLICNFDWGGEEIGKTLGPNKSYVIKRQTAKRRGAPFAKEKQIPETVRSMVDLHGKTCRKRKSQKALPARLRDTYLCYPFLHNLQVKSLKSIQKSKERIKDKNLTCVSPRSSAKSNTQQLTKYEVHKKLSENFGFKRQKSEATAIKPQTSDSKTAPTKTTVNQSSSNTVLYLNNKGISDCCSIDLLLSEDTKNSFTLSVSSFSTKQNMNGQTTSEQLPCQIQTGDPNSNYKPEGALDEVKNLPIVLHPAKSDTDDLSFPSMIIHSDSFLKCFSGFAITRSKLESLFKSNSDMKFYPGRIPKHGSESKPLVTFVLTPKQKKTAALSLDKIHTATKPDVVEFSAASTLVPTTAPHSEPEKKRAEVKPDKSSDKISFQSIEKLNESSEYGKRTITPNKLQENSNKKEQKNLTRISSSRNRKKKFLIPSQISPSKHPVDRKDYHECRKRQGASAKIDIEVKKSTKTPEKTKENQKKIKIVGKKEKPEKSHLLFPNKVKDFTKALEILKKNSSAKNKESKKYTKKKNNLTMEAVNFSKKCQKSFNNNVQNNVTAKSIVRDFDTETAAEEIANSTKTLLNFLPNLFEILKTALTQAEDFKNKAEIISIIEKELEKRKPKCCEVAVATNENFDDSPTSPRKLKTVKIKIYCSEHKCSEQSKKAENPAQKFKIKKSDFLEEIRTVQVFPAGLHEQAEEVDMLNSLVSGEAKDGDLERQNSTYFDALEKTLPDETAGTGKEMGDSQKMYQRPLEGVLDLNAEFGVKETKSQSYPLPTPSDEKLLFKDCFTKESEEAFIIKITKSLKEDKISHSIALLEEFLKKVENSPNHKDTCLRLSQILLLLENESRNLLMKMEKKAWIKVLSLLEELFQIFEGENIEGSMRDHLQMTKAFINKIQALNLNRLVDLQNFCCILCQKPTTKNNGNHIEKVFSKMCESLNFLKQKFIMKRSCICRETEKITNCENKNQDNELRFKLHSTISLPDIGEKASRYKEKNQLEYLKRQIKQQKICIEQLMELGSDFVPQEFEYVKNKVAKK